MKAIVGAARRASVELQLPRVGIDEIEMSPRMMAAPDIRRGGDHAGSVALRGADGIAHRVAERQARRNRGGKRAPGCPHAHRCRMPSLRLRGTADRTF